MTLVVLFIDFAVKSLLVLGLAWLAVLLLRRNSASVRHLVWLAAFCVLLAMPLVGSLVPAQRIPLIQVSKNETPLSAPEANSSASEMPTAKELVLATELLKNNKLSTPIPAQIQLVSNPKPAPVRPDWGLIGQIALFVWIAGAAVVAAQSLWAFFAIRKLRDRSVEIDPIVDRSRLARQVGITRHWELRVCEESKAPAAMTWGVMNPIVLIPQESSSWSAERLEAVLLHELAHVRRFDSVSQLIAVFACVFYWFNPAVWLCARAMRSEAETAADDTVLRMGVKPSDYARELVRIAAELGARRQPYSTIGVPVMKKSKIESRVQAILDPSSRRRQGVTTVQALSTIALAVVLTIPLTTLRASAKVPVEPHIVALQTGRVGQEENARQKVLQEYKEKAAQEEAVTAKELAEKYALLAQNQKQSAEKQARLAEKQALRAKKEAELQRATAAKMAYIQAMRNQYAALRNQKSARKQQDLAKIQQILAQKKQLDAEVRLKAALESLKAQEASVEAMKKQLAAQIRELQAEKARLQSDQAAKFKGQKEEADAVAARMKTLYEQGYVSKEEAEKAREAAVAAKRGDAPRKSDIESLRIEEMSRGIDGAHSLLVKKEQLRIAEVKAKAAVEAAAQEEQRYKAGIVTKQALDKAKLEVATTQSDVVLLKIVLEALTKAQKK